MSDTPTDPSADPSKKLTPPKAPKTPTRPNLDLINDVTDVAKSVGKGVEDAAKSVGKGVEDAAKTVGRNVEDAAKTVGKGVEGAAKTVGKGVGKGVEGAAHVVGKAASVLGQVLETPIFLPGLGGGSTKHKRPRAVPGAAPGIENQHDVDTPPAPGEVTYRHVAYSETTVHDKTFETLEEALADKPPADSTVCWINIDGLHPHVIHRFRETFDFHLLAAEDVMNVPQRSKLETYDDHLFLVTRMLQLKNGVLFSEQISFFLYKDRLITFQEHPGDVWQPIRDRIHKEGSRVRKADTSYLLYALLDAIVDHCFPILEHYGERLEALEARVLLKPDPHVLRRVHSIKRELTLVRRIMWPMREMVDHLCREETDLVTGQTHTYLRDVTDHAIQIIDIIETYREMAGSLTDLYMSAVGNKMNEVMKVLTIIATFFIPITFVAGVYGMNLKGMPEMEWTYAYPAFWVVCLLMTLGLFIFFWRKGWIGNGDKK